MDANYAVEAEIFAYPLLYFILLSRRVKNHVIIDKYECFWLLL